MIYFFKKTIFQNENSGSSVHEINEETELRRRKIEALKVIVKNKGEK